MTDSQILNFLFTNSESFQIRCNAHRDSRTTVARHLLHRERLGEMVLFDTPDARLTCVDEEALWELSFRALDGSDTHLAAPSLELCLKLARAMLTPLQPRGIAA
ncbi:hypothetical protein [Sphingobium sp.]|uniref:hypothetical protein n=1 Tax=Sphingobium sp. TaxID=1912891 RepID=UPI002BCC46C3|nr:hypothetical protein [Sphingobium sp.]HUD95850.1 hypothetical protein [Sphingobium sp.]